MVTVSSEKSKSQLIQVHGVGVLKLALVLIDQ